MTTQIALPTGSYVNRDPRSSCKRLVGCFSEIQPQTAPPDSKSEVPPISIRRAFGITPFASVPVVPSPVLLAPLNGPNNSTGVIDVTGNSAFGAALNGTITTTAHSLFGGSSLYMPNTGALGIEFGAVAPLPVGNPLAALVTNGDFTIEGWFMVPVLSFGNFPLFDYGGASYGDQRGIFTIVNPSPSGAQTISVYATSTGWGTITVSLPALTIQAGVWYAFAVVRTGTTAAFYFNGNPVGNTASGWIVTNNPPIDFTIGGTNEINEASAPGYLQDIRITQEALYSGPYTPAGPFPVPVNTNLPVRGIHTMAGVTYTVIGQSLYTLSSAGVLTQIANGIFGSSFVRMADNTACLVILIPGTAIAYTYSLGGGFQPLINPGFTYYGAIDVGFCDSFIVFLALNGREFFNDDGQNVSGQGQITFTSGSVFPREFGTDLFVGMGIDHREIILFGILSTEGYLNAGNAVGSPFSSAPSSFMEIGIHPLTAYCVAKQDQALFFIGNDLTVRRRSGQTPTRVSNSGIESILMTANLTGSYALTPSAGGHPMYAIVIPADQRTLVYDCLTTEWFELESAQIGYWRPLCWYNAFGKQLVGDSVSSSIGYLDVTSYTEFGLPLTASFTTQSIFDNHNRIIHRRIELVITAGEAPDLETDPEVTLWVSDDSGSSWYARETYGLGFRGQRQMRVYWTNLGQSRDRVYRFTISDPTPAFTVAILAELDGGRW